MQPSEVIRGRLKLNATLDPPKQMQYPQARPIQLLEFWFNVLPLMLVMILSHANMHNECWFLFAIDATAPKDAAQWQLWQLSGIIAFMNARKFRENQIVLILLSGLDVFVYKSVFDLNVTIVQSRDMNIMGKTFSIWLKISIVCFAHTKNCSLYFLCFLLCFLLKY